MKTTPKNNFYSSSTVIKSVNLLDVISRSDDFISLEEITQLTGFKKSTCHRLLQTLASAGLVSKSPKTKSYRLGPKLISLGLAALNRLDLHEEALPYMKKMRDETGETVNLSILDGHELLIIERFRSLHLYSMNLSVGSRLPLHCTSQGKAMLAFLPEEKREQIVSSVALEKLTPNTIADKDLLYKDLEKIRKAGYAINRQEFEIGVYAVAGPILNHEGQAFASLNISYPHVRHPETDFLEQIAEKIIDTCHQLSMAHGYSNGGTGKMNHKKPCKTFHTTEVTGGGA